MDCLVEFTFAANLSAQTAPHSAQCLLLRMFLILQALFRYEMKFPDTVTHKPPEGDGDVIKYSSQKYNH